MNDLKHFSFACLSLFALVATHPVGFADAPVLVERFDAPPSADWMVEVNSDSDGTFDWKAGEAGLAFMTPMENERPGLALREWPIGDAPFEATWQVALQGGQGMGNRAPAIHVAITSGPPEQMKADEGCSIHMGVGNGGISAGVYTGPFMVLNQNLEGYPPYRSRYQGKWVDGLKRSSEGMANAGWFEEWLNQQTLTLQIRRTEDGKLQFTVWHHDISLVNPWWQEEIDVPAAMAGKPLTHLLVMVSPNRAGTPLHGPQSRVRGRLLDLQVRPLTAPRPEIVGIEAANGVAQQGGALIIRGEQFGALPLVTVSGEAATVVESTDNGILVQLPDLPEGTRHPLELRHANGLIARWPAGVPYGRMLEEVQPREVHPDGGDDVTLLGAGFTKDVKIMVNGSEARILEHIDPTRIRILVPAGASGPAKIQANADGQSFSGNPVFAYAPHPYVLHRAEDLDDLRRKFNEPMFANYRALILEGAEQNPDPAQFSGSNAANSVYFVWMAYLMNNEPLHREKLMSMMNLICAQRNYHQFQIQKAAVVATVYDSLFKELSPGERQMMIEYLDRALDHYLDRTKANDWWFAGNVSNTITVGANGGGLAALALMYSRGEDAQTAIDTAASLVKNLYLGIAEDGSCIEGTLYWDYGLTQQVMLGHAFRNALGDDLGLLSQERLERNVNFAMSQMGGNGVMFVNNDTQPWLTGLALAADFGSRYDQPFMRWLADEMVRLESLPDDHPERKRVDISTRGKFIVTAFLYRDRTPAPKQMPPLPTAMLMPSVQWATLRSGPEFRGPMALMVKGHQGPLAHHKQPDKGNFQLHARGEAFIITPGYYASRPRDLSVPLIDGETMDKEAETAAPITALWEQGDLRGISVDSTAPYAKTTGARRVARHFVMVGDEAVVQLDDILPGEGAKGEITAQWQAQYVTEANGSSAVITGDDSALRIETHGPALQLEVEGPRKFGRAWVYRKMEEKGLVSWHSTRATYIADESRPLVTVLQIMDKNGKDPGPSKAVYEKDRILVTLAGGRTVEFTRTAEGWASKRP